MKRTTVTTGQGIFSLTSLNLILVASELSIARPIILIRSRCSPASLGGKKGEKVKHALSEENKSLILRTRANKIVCGMYATFPSFSTLAPKYDYTIKQNLITIKQTFRGLNASSYLFKKVRRSTQSLVRDWRE